MTSDWIWPNKQNFLMQNLWPIANLIAVWVHILPIYYVGVLSYRKHKKTKAGKVSFPLVVILFPRAAWNLSSFILPSILKILLANTMSSINSTVSQIYQVCNILGTHQWREEYFTAAVYKSLIATSVINGLSFPFTALLNAVFILSILFKPNLRRKKSTIMMGYLAVTDLLVGVIVQPMFLASALCQITGRCSSCAVDTVRAYLLRVSCGLFMSHSSHGKDTIAVKHARQYKLVVTTKRILAGIIAAWFVSVAFICITFFHVTLSNILLAIELLISFAVIVYFYKVIYLESMRHRREIKASNPLPETNRLRENEFMATKTTAVIFCCLLICYGPSFVVIRIRKFFLPGNSSYATNWAYIYPWIPTLAMLSSLLNPLIYGWRVKEFRDVIASVFQIFKCYSSNTTRQSEIEIIEMVELNADGRLTNGSFADSHRSRCNIAIDTSDEARNQHRCESNTTIFFAGIPDNVDSANDL